MSRAPAAGGAQRQRDRARLRVVVTRPAEQSGRLASRIEALGHEAVLCPLLAIEALGDEPIDVEPYDWVVITSPNGARELARRRRGKNPRLAAIGPGTAAALRECGLEPQLVATVSTQEGLAADLPRPAGRVLLAAAADARGYLVEELGAEFLPLYRTIPLRPERPPEGDLVVLASASAAEAAAEASLELPAVSIGPETTRAAEAAGLDVIAEAETHDLDGLVRAIEQAAVRLRSC